jgi:hypothetical protein
MKELLTKTVLSDKVEEKFWVCWHAAHFSAKYSQTSVYYLENMTLEKGFCIKHEKKCKIQ